MQKVSRNKEQGMTEEQKGYGKGGAEMGVSERRGWGGGGGGGRGSWVNMEDVPRVWLLRFQSRKFIYFITAVAHGHQIM